MLDVPPEHSACRLPHALRARERQVERPDAIVLRDRQCLAEGKVRSGEMSEVRYGMVVGTCSALSNALRASVPFAHASKATNVRYSCQMRGILCIHTSARSYT